MAAIKAASGVWDKIYASTTYLGIGERAGNAETEKVLLNLYLHYGVKKYEGKTQKLKATADYIGKATGYVVPPNKAIVGDYGFAHESGIHTHGVLNDPWTYEPYPPELVGNERRLTIGKQSGKGIIKHKITELAGNEPDDQTVAIVVDRVKEIYANGRRASLKEEEFKKILRILKILPENNTTKQLSFLNYNSEPKIIKKKENSFRLAHIFAEAVASFHQLVCISSITCWFCGVNRCLNLPCPAKVIFNWLLLLRCQSESVCLALKVVVCRLLLPKLGTRMIQLKALSTPLFCLVQCASLLGKEQKRAGMLVLQLLSLCDFC